MFGVSEQYVDFYLSKQQEFVICRGLIGPNPAEIDACRKRISRVIPAVPLNGMRSCIVIAGQHVSDAPADDIMNLYTDLCGLFKTIPDDSRRVERIGIIGYHDEIFGGAKARDSGLFL